MRPTTIEIVCHLSDALFLSSKLRPKMPPPFPFKLRVQTMPRRTIRLSSDTDERLKKVRGYNPSVFLRTAIESFKPASRGATRVAAGPRMGIMIPTTIVECAIPSVSFHGVTSRRQNGEGRQIVAQCGILAGRWHA
jgi:hypothetical protein